MGKYYSLEKVKRNGEFSTAKYSTSSLPLAYYSNNEKYNALAREHDGKNMEFEVVEISDYSHIVEYFQKEIDDMKKQIEYYVMRCGWNEDADLIVECKKRIEQFEEITNEYSKEKQPNESKKAETDTEHPKTAKETAREKEEKTLPRVEEKPQETADERIVKYYEINEEVAHVAKHINSFSDYKNGEATEIYMHYVDNANNIAKRQIAQYPEEKGKILYYLDKYSKKLAEWYNEYYRNEASCPSIMISGGANFPVRKKEKQNSRRDTLNKERQYIDGLLNKIKGIGMAGIKSGDANAVEKLEKKISELEANHKRKMAINKYYKKNGTLEGCSLMTEEEIKKTMDFITRNPIFQPCITCNDTQNIRRYKKRLESIKTAKKSEASEQESKHCKIVKNTEIMRIQLLFDGKPSGEIRNILKSNGFRWAPSQSAWQRNLNNNGEYAVKRVLEELDKITA